jgi:hypothetical protein
MNAKTLSLLVTMLVAASLSGCFGQSTDAKPTADSYQLVVEGAPAQVDLGQEYTFTLKVTGSPSFESDHIGAHYGAYASAQSPSTAVYTKACEHQSGTLAGTFTVKCTANEAGTIHLRGHARVLVGEQTFNYWAPEVAIKVVAPQQPDLTLSMSGLPTSVAAGQAFNFTLEVSGPGAVASDHIGGHFGMNSTTTPSTLVYDKACVHQAAFAPGTFSVTCTAATAGTHYLRGHLRIASGDQTYNWWSAEQSIQVT